MFRRRVVALVGGVLVAAALVPSAAGAASAPSELFVLTAGSGRLVQSQGGFSLVLNAPSRSVTGFSDRPQRLLGRRTLGSFVSGWGRLGFAADPPNAALVVDGAPSSDDVNVFELARPAIGRGGRTLTFSARRLTRAPTGLLSRYARAADRPRVRSFGRSSLFIDGSGQDATLVFAFTAPPLETQGGGVTFSNATIFDSDADAASGSTFAEVGVTAKVVRARPRRRDGVQRDDDRPGPGRQRRHRRAGPRHRPGRRHGLRDGQRRRRADAVGRGLLAAADRRLDRRRASRPRFAARAPVRWL